VKVGFPGGPRLEWYDRNAINGTVFYLGTGVAPHSVTVRATYTVPTGKKALIGAICLQFLRVTAAGTVGQIHAYFDIGPGLGLTGQMLDNNVGAHLEREVNMNSVLLEGEGLGLSTLDLSTGGTVNYGLSAAIMEFDA